MAMGGRHLLMASDEGDLYCCGMDDCGQLGLNRQTSTWTERPTLVRAIQHQTIVSVAAGACHSVALASDGKVWTWGRGDGGRLGLGDTLSHPTPKCVRFSASGSALWPTSMIAAGASSTILLSSTGELLTCGEGASGLLGHGEGSREDVLLPKEVEALSGMRVVDAVAGARHMVVQCEDGAVYCWGHGGRLLGGGPAAAEGAMLLAGGRFSGWQRFCHYCVGNCTSLPFFVILLQW